MNSLMRAVGVIVTLGLVAVSVLMNFRFGQSLGRTDWDGLVYGLASACADGFKVILPFAIMAAWTTGRRVAASAGGALWLVFTGYSMTSSLGHSAVNRAETTSERRHQIADYRDVRRTIEVKLKEREGLAAFRPMGAVEAQLKAAERSHRFERTQGCTDVSRSDGGYCEQIARLRVELAIGKRAREIEEEIARLRTELGGAGAAAKSEHGDAQTALLGELSGIAENYVRLTLTVLVSVMVELGSGLGLYVVVGRRNPAGIKAELLPPTPRGSQRGAWRRLFAPSPAEAWRRARTARDVTGHASEIELYRDYCLWIVKQDRGPALALGDFRQWLEAEQVGEPVRKRGRLYFVGVTLVTPLLGHSVTEQSAR